MRALTIVFLTLGMTTFVWTQTDTPVPRTATAMPTDNFFRATGALHVVLSEISEAHAQEVLAMAEALFEKYNSYFQFDKGSLTQPFKIRWFADKAGFDAYLVGKVSGVRTDFVYLSWRDITRNELIAWGSGENWFNSLAFQGFIQFLWSFIPNPPVWMRNGYAYMFWDLRWDAESRKVVDSGNLTFLEAARNEIRKGAPDLRSLLTIEDGRTTPEQDYLAWAMVHFLSNSVNVTYVRLLAHILMSVAPAETLANNSQAVLNRIASARSLSEVNTDMMAHVNALQGFSSFMESGIDRYRAGNWEAARTFFRQALELRPTDFRPHYYLGLTAYSEGKYDEAQLHYENAQNYNPPPGLIPYALGLNSFYQRAYDRATAQLRQAIAENPNDYRVNAEAVLGLMQ